MEDATLENILKSSHALHILEYCSKETGVELFCKVQNLRQISVFISSGFCMEHSYRDVHGDTTAATMMTALAALLELVVACVTTVYQRHSL